MGQEHSGAMGPIQHKAQPVMVHYTSNPFYIPPRVLRIGLPHVIY